MVLDITQTSGPGAWGSPQVSRTSCFHLDLSFRAVSQCLALQFRGPGAPGIGLCLGPSFPFSSNRAPGRVLCNARPAPLYSCPWPILQTQGMRLGLGLMWAPHETGEMPTIKQLQLRTFLIISEEKKSQADGVQQNEKWKQEAGPGRQATVYSAGSRTANPGWEVGGSCWAQAEAGIDPWKSPLGMKLWAWKC